MTCRICDKEVVKISPRQVLCSDECRADAKRKANAKYKKPTKALLLKCDGVTQMRELRQSLGIEASLRQRR